MQKCYCDRCGKEMDETELYNIEQRTEGFGKGKLVGTYFGQVHQWQPGRMSDEFWSPRVDLCLSCREDLDSVVTDFMNQK